MAIRVVEAALKLQRSKFQDTFFQVKVNKLYSQGILVKKKLATINTMLSTLKLLVPHHQFNTSLLPMLLIFD